MTEVIVFPSVEKVLVAALNAVLDVPVSTKVPAQRPPSFVRLVRVGGSRPNLVTDRSIVTFECWATDEPAAERQGALTYGPVLEPVSSMPPPARSARTPGRGVEGIRAARRARRWRDRHR